MVAVYGSLPAIVTALVEAGADINALDAKERTPLQYAATFSRSPEIVGALRRVSDRANIPVDRPLDKVARMMRADKRSNLRSGPGKERDKVGLLEVGQQVRVIGEVGNWLQIDVAGGAHAFVYAPLLSAVAVVQFGPDWIIADNQPCQIHNPFLDTDSTFTATWSGGCVDGRASGKGQLLWQRGDVHGDYQGQMSSGRAHGQGVRVTSGGFRYKGEWRDGLKHGRGIETWPSGGSYDGEWRDNRRHGQGVLVTSDGDRYEGEWRNHAQNGQGTYNWANGDRYEGGWRNNGHSGPGTKIWANGTHYEGEWSGSYPHGWGIMTCPNGVYYEGQWAIGFFRGQDGRGKMSKRGAENCGVR